MIKEHTQLKDITEGAFTTPTFSLSAIGSRCGVLVMVDFLNPNDVFIPTTSGGV